MYNRCMTKEQEKQSASTQLPSPRSAKHVQVRFSDAHLLESLKQLAAQDHRSLNGEILQALQEFVERRLRETK